MKKRLTVFVHAHDETFPQSARLALVPVSLVHHTLPGASLTPGNMIKYIAFYGINNIIYYNFIILIIYYLRNLLKYNFKL